MKEKLTSSQVVSHVRDSHMRGKEKEKMTTDTSGRICYEQYDKSSPLGLLVRMFLESLTWHSTRCSLIWKKKDTPAKRLIFQLVPSTLPIEDQEYGLWPTITASFGERGGNVNPESNHDTKKALRNRFQEMGLLPTPAPGTHDRGMHPNKGVVNALLNNEKPKIQELLVDRVFAEELKKQGVTYVESFRQKLLPTPMSCEGKKNMNCSKQNYVSNLARKGLLPTPTSTSDVKGGCTRPDPARQEDTLAHAIHGLTGGKPGTTSQLNPLFVAEMMGFPSDWTVLPFQSGETNQ